MSAVTKLTAAMQESTNTTNPELNSNQVIFTKKMQDAVLKIATEVLNVVKNSFNMKMTDFIKDVVTPKQAALTELDERTSKFFQKVLGPVNMLLDANEATKKGFSILEMFSADEQIRKKVVEGVALPSVKELIKELDSVNPNIINDVLSD